MKRSPLRRKTPLRRVGKRARVNDTVWQANREACLRRAGGMCEWFDHRSPPAFPDATWWMVESCWTRAAHVHHRLPTSQGGTHDLDNLVALCARHHAHIHAHPAESYEAGWLKRRTAS